MFYAYTKKNMRSADMVVHTSNRLDRGGLWGFISEISRSSMSPHGCASIMEGLVHCQNRRPRRGWWSFCYQRLNMWMFAQHGVLG